MKWHYVTMLIFMVMFLPFAQGAISDPSVSWCIPPCFVDLEVVTGSAINITRESAILQGNLISLGDDSEVNVSFQWGVTISLGLETELQERNDTGIFFQQMIGLEAEQIYYFRARALGENGTDVGLIRSFTTVAILPVELVTNITILIAGIIVFILAIVIGFWIQQAPVLLIGGLIGTLLGLWFIFTFTEIFVGLSFIALGIIFAYIGWVNIEGMGD